MHQNKQTYIQNLLAEAGKSILEIYNSDNFGVQIKSDNSPVTQADKASSKIINKGLGKLFPEIPIVDEENDLPDYQVRKNWKRYYLLDPLDGTKEFINQNGEFCINLALMEDNRPLEAWVYQPLKEKGWYCKKGSGIFEFCVNNGLQKLEIPNTKSNKIRIVTSRSFFKPLEAKLINDIEVIFPLEIIHYGSTLKQVEIILGNADMYLKAGPCAEWDTAPGQLMVEEFGGAALQLHSLETMVYNKSNLRNPHFVMLNENLNNPDFVNFLKGILKKYSAEIDKIA